MIERLEESAPAAVPRHVAIIMDGNRRWASAHGMPAIEGHRRGVRALQRTVAAAGRAGVDVLTVYAFSEENWFRPTDEVKLLMELARTFARREADALLRANVRARIIGRRERLPRSVTDALAELESRTASATGMIFNIAIDYSARTELADAIRALAVEVAAGRLAPEAIDEAAISAKLTTAGLPDPDLMIRTGGDLRLSNFLLYQCAYTELWSTQTPWPEFDGSAFDAALAAFAQRKRRFGR
ncbi:MAG: polyprenyl diphosphate synthase [Candidatus Velthaea sp.]